MTQATEVKSRPMIFGSPMVRALLDGRKTQTRRIIKPQPRVPSDGLNCIKVSMLGDMYTDPGDAPIRCCNEAGKPTISPFRVGDELWVREAWSPDHQSFYPHWPIVYRAEYRDPDEPRRDDPDGKFRWRSPIHMSRWASRITLQITDLRVERAHQISDADVVAEGVDEIDIEKNRKFFDRRDVHALAYGELFNRVNGRGSWAKNPWLWCVSFKRIGSATVEKSRECSGDSNAML